MRTPRNYDSDIGPVEIEPPSENGDAASAYIFDITDYLLAGDACTGVVLALAAVLERDPDRLAPLSSVVDCDAIECLLRPRRYGDLRDDVSVTFPYDVYEVTVWSSGRVVVRG